MMPQTEEAQGLGITSPQPLTTRGIRVSPKTYVDLTTLKDKFQEAQGKYLTYNDVIEELVNYWNDAQ